MNTEIQKEKIAKYAADFESYSQWAQGMQMMLAMCLKAGLPLPSPEILIETEKDKQKG